MKVSWRNPVAYFLLAAAAASYLLSIPAYLEQLAMMRDPEAYQPRQSSFALIIAWLTNPLYLVGWAAVVEYLSRIATALERPNQPPDTQG